MSLDRIGKYRVVAKVGEGAMGEVYKAHDPLLNRFVALKTISPALAADPQFKERFIREAQSAAGLNHPNIITIYEFGEEAGLTYMAMEFLEGVDLRESIRAGNLGHLGRKIEVMEQLCEGVGFAHSRGVVHRDLKPGNIYVQPSGHVKVLDFGLARLGASDMTRTGTVMGTPHYMSPEQLKGQKADARSDVFALGAIFYELLSGARAFEGQAMHEMLQKLRDRDPVPLRHRAPATPASLAALVDRAMARDPAARFKDAAEMGRALAHAQDELTGETLARPRERDEATERTLLQAAGATIVEPQPRPRVAGTSALDVGRHHHETSRTVRPDATVAAGPATEVGNRYRPLIAGAVVLVLGAAAAGLWLRSRTTAPASSPVPVGAMQDELGMITDVVVTGKVELAHAQLGNKDYAAAATSATEALDLDPQNADAKQLLEQAEAAKRELDAAVAAADAAVVRGDAGEGQRALKRVLELDPRHEVIARLSPRLDQAAFRQQAEDARRQMAGAQAAAEKARAAGLVEFAAAGKLATAAEAHLQREEFTFATQKFLASRKGFEEARRAAETIRAAEAARQPSVAGTPRPAPVTLAAAPTVAPPLPSPSVTPSLAPSAAPTPLPTVASVPSPSPSAPLPTAAGPDARIGEIERVLSAYERAYETLNVGAFRSVMDVSPDVEKGLREAFKNFKSYDVVMSGATVDFEGDGRARVRVSRVDTVNGRQQPPKKQTFVLTRQGDSWRIVSYAFDR